MLKQYRKTHKITQKELAAMCGVSNVAICDLERGNRLPSLALATRIERVTNGAVPANSWIPAEKQE